MEIPEEMDPRNGNDGVVISKIRRGSDAFEAGLRKGDIIRSVNNADIDNLPSFEAQIAKKKGAIFLSVQRGRNSMFIAVR